MRPVTRHSRHRRSRTERQLEVEDCLQRHDLGEDSRLGSQASRLADKVERRVLRIRRALYELGPAFIAFGLYLSSRNDLLPAFDCVELGYLTDEAQPISAAEVEQLVGSELGRTIDQAFLYFDLQPCASRLITQSHTGLLTDGSAVMVSVLRPDFQLHFEEELELMSLLQPAFTCSEWPELNLDDEVRAFARSIRTQSDLAQQAVFLEALALDANDFDLLRVPDLHRPLCSSAVLTTGCSSGSSVIELLEDKEHAGGRERYATARQLCLVWLRQALFGRAFPVELRPEHMFVFSGGQVAFQPGALHEATQDSKKNLFQYLTAVLAEDPDQACYCLLRQATTMERNADTESLRASFRQVASFHCGEWRPGSHAAGLAERLLLHWRLLYEHGYQLQDQLANFHRALFQMTQCCHRLTSTGDPLREAAEQLRVINVVDQFRHLPPMNNWKGDLSRYATLMMELPRRLDEFLSLTAAGTPRLHVRIDTPRAEKRRSGLPNYAMALCGLLAAAAIVVPRAFRPLIAALGMDRTMMLAIWLLFIFLLRSE
jgi:ubiquinone biosynthesis protein